MAGLSADDLTLIRRVLNKLDRWYTPASGLSSPSPKSVTVQASGTGGNGQGVLLSQGRTDRIGLLLFSPAGAAQLYVSNQEQFGIVNVSAKSAQYGMYFSAGTYLSFSQEYVGSIFAYNSAALSTPALDVRVFELFADFQAWLTGP